MELQHIPTRRLRRILADTQRLTGPVPASTAPIERELERRRRASWIDRCRASPLAEWLCRLASPEGLWGALASWRSARRSKPPGTGESARSITREFTTVRQFAAETGASPKLVRAWIREGQLPAVRLGRRTFIPDDALRLLLARQDRLLRPTPRGEQ